MVGNRMGFLNCGMWAFSFNVRLVPTLGEGVVKGDCEENCSPVWVVMLKLFFCGESHCGWIDPVAHWNSVDLRPWDIFNGFLKAGFKLSRCGSQ